MMIWRLRQALNDPLLGAPSAWRGYVALSRRYPMREAQALPVISALANLVRGIGLVFLPIVAILFGAPLMILLMFLVFTASPILVPLSHLIYGIAIAYHVSGKISHEHEIGTYDLYSTLPSGIIGLHWTYATHWMIDHRVYRNFALVMVGIGMVTMLFSSISLFGRLSFMTPLHWITSSACGIALLIFDHFGTQVTAALLSMLFPTKTSNATNARFGAIGVFVAVQITAYLVGILVASVILPPIYQWFGVSDAVIAFTLPLLTLIAFVSFREWVVRRLWVMLRGAVNATRAEMEALC